MKEEFDKIAGLYGISKDEAKKLDKQFASISDLANAISNNQISFLSAKDIERLKKWLDKAITRVCPVCGYKLPLVLDKGICPMCRRRTGLWQ